MGASSSAGRFRAGRPAGRREFHWEFCWEFHWESCWPRGALLGVLLATRSPAGSPASRGEFPSSLVPGPEDAEQELSQLLGEHPWRGLAKQPGSGVTHFSRSAPGCGTSGGCGWQRYLPCPKRLGVDSLQQTLCSLA